MARTGITQQDVEAAALQLQGRGKNPTVDAIREVLGTGSKSTIIQHLKTWKSQSEEAQGRLPPELLALVTGLWERLNAQAELRITDIQSSSTLQIEECKMYLQQSQQENIELKNKHNLIDDLLQTERQAKTNYEQQLAFLQQEYATLMTKHQASTQQLEDQKLENNRLHVLAMNIQTNLEHYQAATQQARAEQMLMMEKQQAEFQRKVAELQQQLVFQSQQTQVFELKYTHAENRWQELLRQQQDWEQTHEALAQEMQKISRELTMFKERSEQIQQQLYSTKIELSDKNKQCTELEKCMAILADKYECLEMRNHKAEDKIESLQNEKLFLIKEKSLFEAQAKKIMQKDIALK